MEHSRYRSNRAGGRNQGILTVRNLTENKIYVGCRPPFDPGMINQHGTNKSSRTSSTLAVKKWWNDPESKRRRRVAKYMLYSTELGRIKSSSKKGHCCTSIMQWIWGKQKWLLLHIKLLVFNESCQALWWGCYFVGITGLEIVIQIFGI